jgi:hypothetical protein
MEPIMISTETINEVLSAIESDCRLRVKPEMEPVLLNMPDFASVSTAELMRRAQIRLGGIKGIRVTDRVMAIAILVSMYNPTGLG